MQAILRQTKEILLIKNAAKTKIADNKTAIDKNAGRHCKQKQRGYCNK